MTEMTWVRTSAISGNYAVGSSLLAQVPQGSTLYRVRFGWGFYGFTSQTANIIQALQNAVTFGIVTTVGNGSETPPNPHANPDNADQPTERYLWWELRTPRIRTYSDVADAVWYDDSAVQEPTDTQGMVSAKTIPGGSTLDVWATWASSEGAWDPSGLANVWYWASAGYR